LASDRIVVTARSTKKKPGPVPKPKPTPQQSTTTAKQKKSSEDGIVPGATRKPTQKRTNWAKGENLLKMMSAVKNWEDKTGEALDSNGEELRLRAYSNVVGTDCRKERGSKKRADP